MSDEPILPSSSSSNKSAASSSGRLPSDNESGGDSAHLPSEDESRSQDAQIPADSGEEVPRQSASHLSGADDRIVVTEDSSRSLDALIRDLTANGGLGDTVPDGYEGPKGTYWKSVEYDDPFTPLLLDPRQVNKITEAMVEHNARVLGSFWDQKTGLMRGAAGKGIARIYGGKDESMDRVERHPKKIRECRNRLLDPEDRHREAKQLLEEQRRRIWEELQQEIQLVLQASEILSSQVQGMIDRAESKGMAPETARTLLHDRFEKEGYEAYDSVEGGGVRWMKPEEYARREKQRRASQVKPIIIDGEKATTIDDLIDISSQKYKKARECFYNGYMDQWIGGILGDTSLASKIANVRKGYGKQRQEEKRAIGFEVALRRLSEHAGRVSKPQVRLEQQSADFGTWKFGKRLRYTVDVANASPRRAWGSIRASSELKGVEVPEHFGITDASFDLILDTTSVRPGTYSGTVKLDIKHGETLVLKVSYTVEPVDIQVSPQNVHLGPVGANVTRTIEIKADSETALRQLTLHWEDDWKAEPEPGVDDDWGPVTVKEDRSDRSMSLTFTIKGKEVKDRQSLENVLVLRLPNQQFVRVPISFRCPWKYTTRVSMIIGAVVFGAFFGVAREMLAEKSSAFEGWALMPVLEFDALIATSLFALALTFITAVPVLIAARKDQRERAS